MSMAAFTLFYTYILRLPSNFFWWCHTECTFSSFELPYSLKHKKFNQLAINYTERTLCSPLLPISARQSHIIWFFTTS